MAEKPRSVTGFVMRRDLKPSEIEEWNDLFEAWEREARKLQGCLTNAEVGIACGQPPTAADFTFVEALVDSLDSIETGQARFAVSFNQSAGLRRRAWVAAELDRLRGLAGALRTDAVAEDQALSPSPVECSDPETLRQDLLENADRLDSQLEEIEATTIEPERSCLLVEAVLTGRSVLARWNALKEHLPRTVDDRTTQRVNSLIGRLLSLPGAVRDLGLQTGVPVVHQVHPERHLDGVEEVKAAYARHGRALESLNSMDSRIRVAASSAGEQVLVDEALHRLEIERLSQARDPWTLVKRTEQSQTDPSLPPWLLTMDEGKHRHGPAVDWGTVVDADIWPRLSTRDRAEAVSDRVRYLLSSTPDLAITIRPSDIVSATNGDFKAWQRLSLDHLETDVWWQTAQRMQGSSSLPHGTLFASRNDLTLAERADRDFLLGKWDYIERNRRELRVAHALTTIHPGDPIGDQVAAQRRQQRLDQLNEEEHDIVISLQKYSVMPRRSLTDSVRAGVTPADEPEPLTRSAEESLSGLYDNRENTAAEPHVAAPDDGFEDLARVPDDVTAAYRLEFPQATDDEIERLARLGLRLEALERGLRRAAAPEPQGVIVAGALPDMDEYDLLRRQSSQLRTVIRLRTAPALQRISPMELKTLEADYADWLARDPDTRVRESHGLLNQALLSKWGSHVETLEAGHGAAVGERGAYWRLLCLSRGFAPGRDLPTEVTSEAINSGDVNLGGMVDGDARVRDGLRPTLLPHLSEEQIIAHLDAITLPSRDRSPVWTLGVPNEVRGHDACAAPPSSPSYDLLTEALKERRQIRASIAVQSAPALRAPTPSDELRLRAHVPTDWRGLSRTERHRRVDSLRLRIKEGPWHAHLSARTGLMTEAIDGSPGAILDLIWIEQGLLPPREAPRHEANNLPSIAELVATEAVAGVDAQPEGVHRPAHHYYIRSIDDPEESDRILREVLKLSKMPFNLNARQIARRLQPRLGADEPQPPSTVRGWLAAARQMEDQGIPF